MKTYEANTAETVMPTTQKEWAESEALIVLGKSYAPKQPKGNKPGSAKCNFTAHLLIVAWLEQAQGPLPACVLYERLVAARNHGCFLPWRTGQGTYVLAPVGEACGIVPEHEQQAVAALSA